MGENRTRKPYVAALWALLCGLSCSLSPHRALADEFFPQQTHQSLFDSDRGTLFQWGEKTGGPDLDEPLVTDRPDFTEASSTVGRGVLQIETGYTFAFDDNSGDRTMVHSFPEPLFRYGILADWLEFRVAWNFLSEQVDGVSQSGSEDLYLGFKIALTPQDGLLPEMAIVPQMTVPTGANAYSADEVLPGVNWLYSWNINDFLATGGSTQINRGRNDGLNDAFHEWAQSWTVNYSMSERVGAYTEWFALFPMDAEEAQTQHYFDGGFTFLINKDIQWDIRGGVGLNKAADDFFVGTGLSLRFF